MQNLSLRQLDGRKVAVELIVQDQKRVLKGVAHFDSDGDLGSVLRVVISDPSGDFEILVRENQWKGKIEPGDKLKCDYLLRLGSTR
jgi:hypothetical protein